MSRFAAKDRGAFVVTLLLSVSFLMFSAVGASAGADPDLKCETAAAKSLAGCLKKVAKSHAKCISSTGSACSAGDAKIAKSISKISTKVSKSCAGDTPVQDAGYGPSMTAASLVGRVEEACQAEVRSLIARSLGGPQEDATGASPEADTCLATAFAESSKMLGKHLKELNKCVLTERKGKTCDTAKMDGKVAKAEGKAAAKIATVCTDVDPVTEDDQGLETVVALTSTQYIDAAKGQARCAAASVHPDVWPLTLDCGPRDVIANHARGTYEQVVLDGAEWGTRCGDGSDFAFWIRLAPSGKPADKVMIAMQGGGVCLFQSDCSSVNPGLLEAMNDSPPTTGIMSNDSAISPFADYTKVYLPYCNQDVFIGGGVTQTFDGGPTIERYGSVNVRAALRYVRDAIWREKDANSAEGFRRDDMHVMFGGFSAGAFGTLYNYHYLLDDLQWQRTTAFPDSALALDNGELLSVANLGFVVIPQWGALPYLPPYCFAGGCAEGPSVLLESSARLEAAPEQRFMILSNQVDNTQVNTTFFSNTVDWVNVLRDEYCNTMGLPGVHYFLPAVTSSIHVISTSNSRMTTMAVDGEVMKDWLGTIHTAPEAIPDRVEEGAMVGAFPGVNPFPCTVD